MTAEPGESVVVDLDREQYEGTVIDINCKAPESYVAVLMYDWTDHGDSRLAAIPPCDLTVQNAQ